MWRRIEDARLGAGSFYGAALFAPDRPGLLYEERGNLMLGTWRGPAWRRWAYSLEGDAIAVRSPGTLEELHVFRFACDASGGAVAHHTHSCGEDEYEACFRALSDRSVSLAYVVRGPAKSYRLDTLLTRV